MEQKTSLVRDKIMLQHTASMQNDDIPGQFYDYLILYEVKLTDSNFNRQINVVSSDKLHPQHFETSTVCFVGYLFFDPCADWPMRLQKQTAHQIKAVASNDKVTPNAKESFKIQHSFSYVSIFSIDRVTQAKMLLGFAA